MDIASFALLDTLTRWVPHWEGGVLRVCTNDVYALRGIGGLITTMTSHERESC